ncbi:MAG TPA: hypothetical protein VGD78_05210 [Chthoniobacterales bacterium]
MNPAQVPFGQDTAESAALEDGALTVSNAVERESIPFSSRRETAKPGTLDLALSFARHRADVAGAMNYQSLRERLIDLALQLEAAGAEHNRLDRPKTDGESAGYTRGRVEAYRDAANRLRAELDAEPDQGRVSVDALPAPLVEHLSHLFDEWAGPRLTPASPLGQLVCAFEADRLTRADLPNLMREASRLGCALELRTAFPMIVSD